MKTDFNIENVNIQQIKTDMLTQCVTVVMLSLSVVTCLLQ